MRLVRGLAIALSGAAAFWSIPASAAPLLAPHRAVYDLALDEASDRSGITSIAGRMVYEFNGSPCEGYTVTFRFVTQIDTQEQSRVTDQQTTTYEDAEGKSFSFVTKSFVDQALDKEVRGKAELDGGETKIDLEKPQASELSLDKTQFPTQHLIELIDNAEKGQSFYETTLFDGSEDGDQIMATTVVIGKEQAAETGDPEMPALGSLKPDHFWPVSIAYFETGDQEQDGEEVPVYSISFKLHDNGITRDLVMDYGEFSMTGKLVDLSMFDAESAQKDCPR